MWENRSKIVFGSGIFIAGMIFLQMSMYALHVLFGWELHFNLFQICSSVVHRFGLDSVAYLLDVLVFYTLTMTIWAAGKQMILSYRAFKRFRSFENQTLTQALNLQYGKSLNDYMVVESAEPLALTMGFFKPRIVLSVGLLQLLDQDELAAVIHHEQYHQKHRDPIKSLLLYLVASVMWYLPILQWFHQNYNIIREVLADQYSITRSGTSAHLGSALIKLLKRGNPTPLAFSHVSFADTSINYRIRQLLEPQREFPLQVPLKPLMISVQILLILCTSFILAIH